MEKYNYVTVLWLIFVFGLPTTFHITFDNINKQVLPNNCYLEMLCEIENFKLNDVEIGVVVFNFNIFILVGVTTSFH